MRVATSVSILLDLDHVIRISLLTFSSIEDREHVGSSRIKGSLQSVSMSKLFDIRIYMPL
jgi:hypothetical protein